MKANKAVYMTASVACGWAGAVMWWAGAAYVRQCSAQSLVFDPKDIFLSLMQIHNLSILEYSYLVTNLATVRNLENDKKSAKRPILRSIS